ncbi:MAG TPA: glycosyltransferase family 2 protein [Scandinavium sp.]|jgi:glycosyltransferase involved in cell wall biosynthesis|uniref:glycosyltransferase family 2 protein n=1 Tax=Scandinavium sp. TaxID=2830653 RepID=UPI002E342B66|nr:glycosyltransferase family 2 protein [Scandinavium sp.]HEX4501692.1 glycosyltransferase family 2 protein [Scandinavium sp.]
MVFISVIIAAHNAGKTLTQTLESLISAIDTAYPEVEVIILNDSSDDNTQRIIEANASRLPGLITQEVVFKNIGQVRNYAVLLAKGQYITMLDSDDLLKPGSLRDASAFLKQHQPDMLLTHLLEIRDMAKITDDWNGFSPISLTSPEAIRRFLIHKDFQAHLIGQFIHRDLYQKAPIPPLICYEDFAVFPSMLVEARKIFFQREGHYYYIKRQSSLSSTLDAHKISHLVACTLSMETVFPEKFQPLINCHWLDIYTNHKSYLNPLQLDEVKRRVLSLYTLGFFFSKDVRFSYKKRAIKALWKK